MDKTKSKSNEEKTKKSEEKEKSENKNNNGVKYAEIFSNLAGTLGGKIIDLFSGWRKGSSENSDLKESNDLQKKKLDELEQLIKKMSEEKSKENQSLIDGAKEWNEVKNKVLESLFKKVDLISIKKTLENYLKSLEEDILAELDKILDEKFKSNSIIQEKYNSIYNNIKGDIKEIKTFNFMLVGFTGAGKSCLTNALLNCSKAEEGHSIKPKTDDIKQFSNPESEPGITIYDTIGIESTNIERGLIKIKEKVEQTFNENLENPDKSLHGILYCINNGSSANRIENGEIQFITELNKLYGESDILIIVFTQSINSDTDNKKKELMEALKNDRIEIIPVLAKDQAIKLGKKEIICEAYGIDDLKKVMKDKCKNKLVKCNLKQIVKKKIIKYFEENINENFENIKKNIKSNVFENTLNEECNIILKNLIGNLNIDFSSMDEIISNYNSKEKMDEIKNKLLEQNSGYFGNELFEEFNAINEKYGNKLSNFNIREINKKFSEYFTSNIIGLINKIYFEVASTLILEKCKKFLGEIISKNIKDEEIDNLIQTNMSNILKT